VSIVHRPGTQLRSPRQAEALRETSTPLMVSVEVPFSIELDASDCRPYEAG
jgi:hypothetical protein